MSKLLMGIFLLISVSAPTGVEGVAGQLDQIAREYLASKSQRDIGNLVALDGRLRHLLDETATYLGQSGVVISSRQTGPFKNMAPSNLTNAGTSPVTSQ